MINFNEIYLNQTIKLTYDYESNLIYYGKIIFIMPDDATFQIIKPNIDIILKISEIKDWSYELLDIDEIELRLSW